LLCATSPRRSGETLRRDGRELVAQAVRTTTGTDLRLVKTEDFRRTSLCLSESDAQQKADEWRRQLIATGWTP
jgi:hypothetical protein